MPVMLPADARRADRSSAAQTGTGACNGPSSLPLIAPFPVSPIFLPLPECPPLLESVPKPDPFVGTVVLELVFVIPRPARPCAPLVSLEYEYVPVADPEPVP